MTSGRFTQQIDAGTLLTATRPDLVRFFRRRCNNQPQAEDLAQEVIARTLARAKWATEGQAKGYIFRTAANLWRDQARHYRIQKGAELSWDENIAVALHEGIPLERALQSEQQLHRVNSALLQLSERTRKIFLLSRLEEMRYTDIAARIGLSVSAIEKHMIKAIAHLQQEKSDHEAS